MKICFFYSILKISFSKDDTHNALHLTIFDRFRKDVKDVHLKTSKDF